MAKKTTQHTSKANDPDESQSSEEPKNNEILLESQQEETDQKQKTSEQTEIPKPPKKRKNNTAPTESAQKETNTKHETLDEEHPFETYLRTAYQRSMMHELGMCVERTGSHSLQVTLPIKETFHQYTGVVHGGILLLLAESAASVLTCLHLDLRTHHALGMQVTANHIRPARAGVLKAVPRILHQGRSTCVCDVSIFGEEDKLVSTARVTLLLRPQAQQGQYEADCQGTRWSKQVETIHLASTQENRFQRSSSRDDRGRDRARGQSDRDNRGRDRDTGRSDRFGSDRREGNRGSSGRFESRGGYEGGRSSSRDDRSRDRGGRSHRFGSDRRDGNRSSSGRFESRGGYEGSRSSSRDDRGRDRGRSDRSGSDRRNRDDRRDKR